MSAALVVGSWSLESIPPGWEIMPGYGLRRAEPGAFPSVLLMVQEPLPNGLTLAAYVEKQLVAADVLLKHPTVRGPAPVTMPYSTEALRVGFSYRSANGRAVVQMQIYATDGIEVGNVTFTTLEEDLPALGATFAEMIGGLRFQPGPAISPS